MRDIISGQTADMSTYADIARMVRAGNYGALTNAYWSPLYPVLIGILLPVRVSVESFQTAFLELQIAVHATYILALIYFLLGISELTGQNRRRTEVTFVVSLLFGVALDFKFAASFNPDHLISVAVLLASGIVIRLLSDPRRSLMWALLGLVLGVAYWAKAVMMPASIGLLIALLVLQRGQRGQTPRPAFLALLVFVVTAVPAVALASIGAHKLTFGEAGMLNFAWNVNGYQMHRGWRGLEPGSGTPLHPPRVLEEKPLVLEFANPGFGTFPLWYDPVFWHQGVQIHLSLHDLAASVIRNVTNSITVDLCLLLSIPSLFLGWQRRFNLGKPNSYYVCFVLWPLIFLGIYYLVALELRYAIPALAVLVAAALAVAHPDTRMGHFIINTQLIVLSFLSLWWIEKEFVNREMAQTRWSEELAVNNYLTAHGVKRNDKIAFVNRLDGSLIFLVPLDVQVVSWLRQGGAGKISHDEWTDVIRRWRDIDVKAVIDLPAVSTSSFDVDVPTWMGFEKAPGSQYFVRMLDSH